MIKLPQQETKSLVALHGWTAVVLGFLLYAVVATGTVAVLADQILHWSVGSVKPANPFQYDVNGITRSLAEKVEPKFHEEIVYSTSPRGNLEVFFHTHRENPNGELEDYGVQFEVDPATKAILQERTGTATELHNTNQFETLSRFLIDIHTELHLPRPWGLLLTGILGLGMLVAAVSGFMMHRHLFADMFVLRKKANTVLKKRDNHIVAGTWGLPFAFILAFTGSFFSFAGAFGIPAMAMVAFGGDQEAMMRTVVGMPETENNESAATANLNTVVSDSARRVEQYPTFMLVSHYGRGDANILVFLEPPETTIEPIQLEYDGVTGEFSRQKPALGLVQSAGSVAFSLVGPLHFGDFAGLLSRLVWVALGFASCYVILSGLSLWVARRGKRWHRFLCFVYALGTGLPVAMLAAGMGYFVALGSAASAVFWVPVSFLAASALVVMPAMIVKSPQVFQRNLLLVCGLLCFALPVLRMVTGGPGWLEAISSQNTAVILVDAMLVVSGSFALWLRKKSHDDISLPAQKSPDRPTNGLPIEPISGGSV
ncbi:PepSY-associated TM helix domain-containing protein [Exilibacterium tricleocarpae]|uniref:PepSY-associated TM helix domain-containing protein n=1 Tax=Exilibacterium tricleocarpae TaxID=2591008 RepID=UPI0015D15245|nr:PepSY-associated TM helix domain-containing protein [Exilibacterium tricleocarpae]